MTCTCAIRRPGRRVRENGGQDESSSRFGLMHAIIQHWLGWGTPTRKRSTVDFCLLFWFGLCDCAGSTPRHSRLFACFCLGYVMSKRRFKVLVLELEKGALSWENRHARNEHDEYRMGISETVHTIVGLFTIILLLYCSAPYLNEQLSRGMAAY